MQHSDFVHLHVHSHYSLLDGAAKVENLVEAAHELKMPALALTDHGNMFGAVEFYTKARSKGIKPIVGSEVYVARNSRFDRNADEKPFHLVLLARDLTGYKNLMKLVSLAYKEGFYREPRIDRDVLRQFGGGLIGMSACLGGELPQALLHGNYDKAKEALDFYRSVFGDDHFFVELQDHGLDEQKMVNPSLIKLAKQEHANLVVTNDSHYVRKKDAEAQDVLVCIQTGSTLEEKDRFAFESQEFYFKSPSEMRVLFPEVPDAYSNTLKIAQACNLELTFGEYHLPVFEIAPQDADEDAMLERLCREALPLRFEHLTSEIEERLVMELAVIKKMGFSSYFLIVGDFIAFARSQGISVGPGRGSAAGSIVAYLLGITNIDPLRYGLYFERFLNPERVSMPDIDIDFCFERRGEVIDYVVKKYGAENVCQIITFSTLSCKAALKDVARVMNIPFAEANRITKAVPDVLGLGLMDALEQSSELRGFADKYPRLFEIAKTIEGVVRGTGKHAAGVVIAPDTLYKFIPLATRDDEVTTQYTMKLVEKLGLLKMDFLGLKTLTVIRNAVENIRKSRGKRLDIDKIPTDDKRTYKLLGNGETAGVFQFESTGFTDLIRRLHPTRFEDLVAVIALYRPGPLGSGMDKDFIEGKHGRKEVTYPHPALKELLEETYGVILYQEQVMKVANILADFTMGQADQLRRAMGKKDLAEMERQRKSFVENAVKNEALVPPCPHDKAETIFALIQEFAKYGFNKSHSAAYALVSYQTAFLKANFPQEFMAATLTNEKDDTDKISFLIEECRRMRIDILPPDVNESDRDFTVVDKKIRFGLEAIKGLGASVAEAVIDARQRSGPFQGLDDFCKRVSTKTANKKAIESLIKCGAFDATGHNRAQLLAVIDQAMALGQDAQRNMELGQSTLLDFCSSQNIEFEGSRIAYPEIPEFPERELLNFEKETLGLYLSGHPLFQHTWLFDKVTTTGLTAIDELPVESTFITGGLIKSVKKRLSKNTNKEFAIVTVEDLKGSYEFLVFEPIFSECRALLEEDNVVVICGKTTLRGGEKRVGVDDVVELST